MAKLFFQSCCIAVVFLSLLSGCSKDETVEVGEPVSGIKFPEEICHFGINPNTLPCGDRIKLEPIISPPDAACKKVTYKSSDNSIASVDEDGWLTGNSIGSATITVTAVDGGFFASTKISVIRKVPPLTESEAMNLFNGKTFWPATGGSSYYFGSSGNWWQYSFDYFYERIDGTSWKLEPMHGTDYSTGRIVLEGGEGSYNISTNSHVIHQKIENAKTVIQYESLYNDNCTFFFPPGDWWQEFITEVNTTDKW